MADDLLRDDARVRDAFRRGERWALAEVYRVYFPIVRTVTQSGFGGFRGFYNPADRDDAIQNIFAAAFEERARLSYNGTDPYTAYLRGIAQNVVRRMLDRSTRFHRTDGHPSPEDHAPDGAEEALIDAEAQHIVRKFVDGLVDPDEKVILQRYFVDGGAEETIAAELQWTRYRVRKVIGTLGKRMSVFVKRHGLA